MSELTGSPNLRVRIFVCGTLKYQNTFFNSNLPTYLKTLQAGLRKHETAVVDSLQPIQTIAVLHGRLHAARS